MHSNKNLVLSKTSTQNEIRFYFEKVLELKQLSEDFPINLDEVWMLVYSSKRVATRSLKQNFIEKEDFMTVSRNAHGGKFASTDYLLSISCLEYFIARKVRPVFDVYRQVFHKVAEQKPLSQLEALQQSVQMLVEQDKRISSVESELKLIKAQTKTQTDYFTVAGYGTLRGIKVPLSFASKVGRYAAGKCKELGIMMGECPDQRFGKVRTYPSDILKEAFDVNII